MEAVLHALHVDGVRFAPAEAPACAPAGLRPGAAGRWLGARVRGRAAPARRRKALDLPPGVFAFELDTERPVRGGPAGARVPARCLGSRRCCATWRWWSRWSCGTTRSAGSSSRWAGRWWRTRSSSTSTRASPSPRGKKNLAYAIRYRSPERTLTDAEVSEAHQRIVAEVNQRLGGALRVLNS